jgi:hypothetical protein
MHKLGVLGSFVSQTGREASFYMEWAQWVYEA